MSNNNSQPKQESEKKGATASPKAKVADWTSIIIAVLLGLAITSLIQVMHLNEKVISLGSEIEARPKVLVVDLVSIVSRLPDSLTEKERSKVMTLFSQYMERKIEEGYLLLQPLAEFAPISRWHIPDAVIEGMLQQVTGIKMKMKPMPAPRVGTMKLDGKGPGETAPAQ